MKKYFQIIFVLTLFFALVVYRQLKGNDAQAIVEKTSVPNVITKQPQQSFMKYKDGRYTGDVTDALYGNIQVQVIIANGKIGDISFLQYPSENKTSISINQHAMPILKSEAIQMQNSQVDIVSGASSSSQAFQKSLSSALQKAS
jgi:uncharacterized protein with FMN-binding domain